MITIHWLFSILLGTSHAATGAPAPRILTMGVPYKFSRIQALVEYHELLSKSFEDIGYKVEFKPIPIQSSHEMLISGNVDSVSYDDLVDSSGREKIITTSFPIAITRGTVFFSKTRPVKEDALEKYRGSISKNNSILLNHASKKKLKFKQTATPYQCIQTVIEKQSDFCITVHEIGVTALKDIPNGKGTIVYAEKPFLKMPIHLSMTKKYESDMPKLEVALRKRLKGDLSTYPSIRDALNTNP
ncbi:hypothetical protein [Bdellovibrio sp. HCB209]|uniref:hypothetical protein n=1 Tax=Bdellovibrio sp. HCB209 TaxID=3394354 RepID=UPI0039B6CA37